MFESEKNNLFHDPFNSKLSDLNNFLNPFKERNFSLNLNQENTLRFIFFFLYFLNIILF